MKTPADIKALKQNWFNDPCWDIETTEGFEEYHDELLAYRLEVENKERNQHAAKLLKLADALGCPGNIVLAGYMERLEDRIQRLEEKWNR